MKVIVLLLACLIAAQACPDGSTHVSCGTGVACNADADCAAHGQICCWRSNPCESFCSHPDGTDHPVGK